LNLRGIVDGHTNGVRNRAAGARSGGLRNVQAELGEHCIARHEFLNLTGQSHRKIIEKPHVGRDFVVRDLTLTESANIVDAGALAFAQFALHCGGFADALTRHAKDRSRRQRVTCDQV
jgi:hypothetical protein